MLEDIAAHARSALPSECCGVLLGAEEDVTDSIRSANLADDPVHHYLIDPKTQFDAMRQARTRGLTVVGFYHSHPRSAPVPSATDLALAAYPDHWYLIVSPLAAGYEIRAWKFEGEGFVEVELGR